MLKMKKIIFIIVSVCLLLGIIGGIYAYKEYNRKNVEISETKAAFTLTEMHLIHEFTQNQSAGNKKYLGKILELTGNIKKIDTAQNGHHTIILGADSTMNSVRCSIDSNYHIESQQLIVGSPIVIKGICTGYNADELGLGSDIILNRSIVIKK